jgi:hypothetical protein
MLVGLETGVAQLGYGQRAVRENRETRWVFEDWELTSTCQLKCILNQSEVSLTMLSVQASRSLPGIPGI